MTRRFAILSVIAYTALLAACGGNERLAVDNGAPGSMPASAGSAPAAPPVSLAGKWTLSSPGTGSCAMTFGATPDATEGTIAPAGGCPFNFFTSRKWNYTAAGLVIRDHNGQVLAQLTPAGPSRFEGRAGSGQDVALSR